MGRQGERQRPEQAVAALRRTSAGTQVRCWRAASGANFPRESYQLVVAALSDESGIFEDRDRGGRHGPLWEPEQGGCCGVAEGAWTGIQEVYLLFNIIYIMRT